MEELIMRSNLCVVCLANLEFFQNVSNPLFYLYWPIILFTNSLSRAETSTIIIFVLNKHFLLVTVLHGNILLMLVYLDNCSVFQNIIIEVSNFKSLFVLGNKEWLPLFRALQQYYNIEAMRTNTVQSFWKHSVVNNG